VPPAVDRCKKLEESWFKQARPTRIGALQAFAGRCEESAGAKSGSTFAFSRCRIMVVDRTGDVVRRHGYG
jgi:hypothetical protein